MRKDPVDPGQFGRRDQASWQRQGAHGLQTRVTPIRIIVGVLALALLLISTAGALIITAHSYAATTTTLSSCGTATSKPTTGSTNTATATPRHHRTPVATPTEGNTPVTPTNTPVAPTDTPTSVAPTAAPTSAAPTNTPVTPTNTSSPQSSSSHTPSSTDTMVMFSMNIHLIAVINFNANDQCTATTAPIGSTNTPDPRSTTMATGSTSSTTPVTAGSTPGTTPVTAGSTPGTTPVITTPGSGSASGAGSRVVLIVSGAFLLLLVGLGTGWFFFRRMLLPERAPNTHLPPSGARPWSRTRVPNPNSISSTINDQVVLNGESGGAGPNMSPGSPMNNNFNGPDLAGFGGPPGANGAGPGGFSDGFIPPSPQIFSPHENSMIPTGSGAFPVTANANGFSPASPAFNAMYGLSDDPFAASQGGTAGWMANLGGGSGFNDTPTTTPNGGVNLAPDQVDLNDPYLAEVIRQYSQKSQTVQQQIPSSGPLQQMSPNLPASPLPQREPRADMQEPNWLQ